MTTCLQDLNAEAIWGVPTDKNVITARHNLESLQGARARECVASLPLSINVRRCVDESANLLITVCGTASIPSGSRDVGASKSKDLTALGCLPVGFALIDVIDRSKVEFALMAGSPGGEVDGAE